MSTSVAAKRLHMKGRGIDGLIKCGIGVVQAWWATGMMGRMAFSCASIPCKQKYLVSTILYFTVNITEPLFLIQNLIYPFKSGNKKKWHWQNYWHPRLNIWYCSLWTKYLQSSTSYRHVWAFYTSLLAVCPTLVVQTAPVHPDLKGAFS